MTVTGRIAVIILSKTGETQTKEVTVISDRLGKIARKISLQNGGVFETNDNDGVDTMFNLHQSFATKLTMVERSWKYVAVIAVLTIGSLIGIYRYGLPALAYGAAQITPSGIVALMDQGTLTTVDKVVFNKSKLEEKRQREITSLFDQLAEISSHKPLRLLFRDGGKLGANAIALPGGSVIITDQLIKAAKSDDEILGVLGHEIGHVELRHSLRQIYRILGIGFMVTVIGGDSGQLVEDVVAQAAALESLSYSRKFETESDYRSAELMVKLNRDPYAFINLLGRLTKDQGKKKSTGWLSTHPGTFDRLATVKRYVGTLEGQ